ncbi:MAG: S9 family peptidase, partial [Elusimicrobiota bacterium]|nr:S9 family peptidase [Elusimicrobiota bacterium]
MASDRSLILSLALMAGPAVLSRAAEPIAPVERKTKGNIVTEAVPDIPTDIAERMLQYQNTRAADLKSFSPDGDGLLMTTRFGETAQVHWLKAPGGARRQLTFFKEPVSDASLSPKPGAREFVFSMDTGGSENYQLYLFRLDEAKPRLLTDGKSRNEGARWSRRGDRLIFNGTARNGKDFDFYTVDPKTGARALLKEVSGQWNALDWSHDDSKVLVRNYVSINESYLHSLDARTGELTPLFPAQGTAKIGYGTARWAGPGVVLFTSDETGEFSRLGRLDLSTRKVDWLSTNIPWNIEEVKVSPDGKRVAFASNEDGIGRLYLGPPSGPFTVVAGVPMGIVYS